MKRSIYLMLIWCLCSVLTFGQGSSDVAEREGKNVLRGKIIVKVKEEYQSAFLQNKLFETPLGKLFPKFSIESVNKKFPKIFKPRGELVNRDGFKLVDLSNIYEIKYSNDFNEFVAAEMFYFTGMFEYAEAQVIPELLYEPNDPKLSTQWQLDPIQAREAWDISKGDTNVVIGITDTGVDTDHPDLVDRFKYNYNDPIDGIDNDGDGYVDNYLGWDTGSDDNDPETWGHHGNQVTGMAAATTDNGENISAIGYNCMILPIKICNDNGYLVGAYDGIVYAADHGADIINCSWGGTGGFSQYNQDLINYATNNKGATVVAAAGNGNFSSYFYPASYDNVISVGGTDADDKKWVESANEGSQYNDKVDVMAPAQNVVALWKGGSSGLIGRGTSFASPLVAGLAGLVKSVYPTASPQKIAAIIKSTTDDISGVPGNDVYDGMIGTGRVNAFKAVSPLNIPYLGYFNHTTDDGFDQNLAPGDTVTVDLEIVNHLAATNNVSVILRATNNLSTVVDSITFVNTIGSGQSEKCGALLKFVVAGSAGMNKQATFEIEMTNGSMTWTDNFSVLVNKDYIDITTNNLDVSFNNYGRIGYTYSGAGLGINYKGSGSLIREMGVLMGVSSTNVLSYEDYELLTFHPATVASGDADFVAKGILDDSWAMSPIGVEIDQLAYAWGSAPDEDYVIYEFIVKNPTTTEMKDIYLGVYGDWDIGDYNNNHAAFDASRNLGYVYEDGGMYAGLKALRSKKVNHFAFNKSGANGIDLVDGFDDSEEYTALSSGTVNNTADGDVANLVSHGPYTIPSGDSIVVAFAIVGGSDLSELKTHAQSAELMYERMRGINISVNNIQNISCNGANDGLIDLGLDMSFPPYSMSWYHDSTETDTAVSGLAAGNYNVAVTDKYGISKLMNFAITEPPKLESNLISTSNVICYGDKNGEVDIVTTGGTGSYQYKWDDPTIPSIENPLLPAGMHEVVVSDIKGCSDTLEVEIESPVQLSVSTTWLLDDTANACAGEASLLANGGVAPYTYAWNNGAPQADEDVYGLCGGGYTVVIEDANGCELTTVVSIDAPEVVDNGDGTNSTQEIVSEFVLYPNPANEYLLAEFRSIVQEEMSISILDLNGKLVQRVFADKVDAETYKLVLNTTKFHVGNYFIRMDSQTGSSAFQFQVQR